MSGAPDIPDGNKKIGLLIAVLALMLAFSEMGNKQAEAESVAMMPNDTSWAIAVILLNAIHALSKRCFSFMFLSS